MNAGTRRPETTRLGRQDSNLGSRDQNPLPYHLATPHGGSKSRCVAQPSALPAPLSSAAAGGSGARWTLAPEPTNRRHQWRPAYPISLAPQRRAGAVRRLPGGLEGALGERSGRSGPRAIARARRRSGGDRAALAGRTRRVGVPGGHDRPPRAPPEPRDAPPGVA